MQQLDNLREFALVFGRDEAVSNEKVENDRARRCLELGRKDALEALSDWQQLEALHLKRLRQLKTLN